MSNVIGVGGGGGGGLEWETAFDIDFATLPDQTLTGDGAHVIGGVTFTKSGSAKEAAAMAVINGVGLRIRPTQWCNWYFTETWPRLYFLLSSVIPNFDNTTRVRVWCYLITANMTDDLDTCVCVFENAIAGDYKRCGWLHRNEGGTTYYEAVDETGGIYYVKKAASLPVVFVLDAADGFPALRIANLYGTWAGGWPAASALSAFSCRSFDTEPNPRTYPAGLAGCANNWRFTLGACSDQATHLVFDVGALKVEYCTIP